MVSTAVFKWATKQEGDESSLSRSLCCSWLQLSFFPYPVGHPEHEHCITIIFGPVIQFTLFKLSITLSQLEARINSQTYVWFFAETWTMSNGTRNISIYYCDTWFTLTLASTWDRQEILCGLDTERLNEITEFLWEFMAALKCILCSCTGMGSNRVTVTKLIIILELYLKLSYFLGRMYIVVHWSPLIRSTFCRRKIDLLGGLTLYLGY